MRLHPNTFQAILDRHHNNGGTIAVLNKYPRYKAAFIQVARLDRLIQDSGDLPADLAEILMPEHWPTVGDIQGLAIYNNIQT